jgi:hypothetical protein
MRVADACSKVLGDLDQDSLPVVLLLNYICLSAQKVTAQKVKMTRHRSKLETTQHHSIKAMLPVHGVPGSHMVNIPLT